MITVTEILFFAAGLIVVEVFKEAVRVLCELKLDEARKALFNDEVKDRRALAVAVEELLNKQNFMLFIPKSDREKYTKDFEKLVTIAQLKLQLDATPGMGDGPLGPTDKGGPGEKPSA